MDLVNGNPNPASNGGFVKPANLTEYPAIIIEPKEIKRDLPGYQGVGTTNHAIVNLTLFSALALQGKAEPERKRNAVFDGYAAVVGFVQDLLDSKTPAAVVKVGRGTAKNGKSAPWLLQPVDPAHFDRVVAWNNAQKEAAKADTEDLDFLDED